MTTRYFKGTIGKRTYFRASKTKLYRSVIAMGGGCVGFSSTVANGVGINDAPVAEITKAEYDRLVALKAARLGENARWTSPQDSWVDA